MNKYENIKDRSDRDFKRLTGVRKVTFQKMVELAVIHEKERKKLPGRPMKLSYENQILMMLEYLREYRTYFRIAADCGISEANCCKLIKKIEDILVKSECFRLPDRKILAKSDTEIEAILIDAAETPIERPEKNRNFITPVKRSGIL
ncbi:MAG: hypothetical protein BWK80_30355 [Desulfobacteraceae bacterium IS3]|nr:MAG: hypothetical protein BWK80_30355 [Desulfobacteraceae bacterium IS3]